MAKNPNIVPVDTSYNVVNTLNQNFESLQEGFENTLSRDGSLPNNMLADLDMDGNDILNVGNITAEDYTLNGVSLNEAVETAATNAVIAVDAAEVAVQKAGEASNSASSALVSRQAAEDAQQAAEAAQEAAEEAQLAAEVAQEAAEEAALEANVALGPLEGGLTGELLQKQSDTDFDYTWTTIAGSGDMVKLVYDPTNKNADAFSMGSMVETASAKILTSTERTKLEGIAAGAQVNTVTSVAGKTGAVVVQWGDIPDHPDPVLIGGSEGIGSYTSVIHALGNSGTSTIKPALDVSNFKTLTNTGAFTLAAPDTITGEAYSICVVVSPGAGAGSMTATGFSDVSGDFEPAVANMLSITVVGSSKWLNIKAVE